MFLDAGTTCEAIVDQLVDVADITVVTNDFPLSSRLMEKNIEAIHTGGSVDFNSGSSTGPLAAATLGSLSIDIAFLSAGAWDLNRPDYLGDRQTDPQARGEASRSKDDPRC